ncbi:zinc finger protein 324A-like [Haliotis rufescens]|uniref:zinc finger protein 324A-like n=1 Tax=Haliotis rufescens TaxID=6454 RepID=UPI00201F3FA7|nr:zinc finger protein 324A-like [Haliotis rufescens]
MTHASTARRERAGNERPFTCPVCGNLYSSQRNVNRHRSVHEGQRFACEKCSRSFASNQKLNKHKCAACSQHRLSEYRCSKCPEVLPSPRDLAVHFRRCHSSGATQTSRHDARPSTSRAVPVSGGTTSTNQPTPSTSSGQVARAGNSRASGAPSSSRIAASDGCTTCRTCHRRFEDRLSLYRHQMIEGHRVLPSQSGGSMDTDAVGSELQPRPWGEGPAPWVEESTGEVTEPGLQEAYHLDAPFILTRDQLGEVFSTYNLPVSNNFSIGELMERAREIYQSLSYSFRFNLAFSVILRHVETGRYRYFQPYAVDPLFTTPLYITELRDLERLRQRLESLDVMSYLLKQRPDTKWKPV